MAEKKCRVIEDVGPYRLTCCLPAGRDGCHWCADIADRAALTGPAEREGSEG